MNFAERQARIEELQGLILAAREDKHARHDDLTNREEREITAKVKDLNALLSSAITDGAGPCPHCGAMPHGIPQQVGIKGEVRHVYEVGCLSLTNPEHPQTRSIDLLPELAVMRWNACKFEEPSEGPGVKLDAAEPAP